ncbi:MAG: ankyrin repeat domain-containing protein, partial [Gemmatimonadota bacterium]
NPLGRVGDDSLVDVARDRGHTAIAAMLQATLQRVHNISADGEPVAAAIRARDLDVVADLLDASPHLLHVGDLRGNQPIHWAVMVHAPAIIDLLVVRGADLAMRRPDGARPIHLTNGDDAYRATEDVAPQLAVSPDDTLAHLRRRGASIDMACAAYLGAVARVARLLEDEPSLVHQAPEYVGHHPPSGSPLRNAAAGGHLSVVRLLLERGADPNLPEERIAPHGHALYSAVSIGHYEIAQLLLEYGAHPNPPVAHSADALTVALRRRDREMVQLLSSYGAARPVALLALDGDVTTAAAVFAADRSRANDAEAMSNAAQQGHEPFVRLLLRHAPALATRVGTAAADASLTEVLFAHGMDPSHRDWLGVTPLHRFAQVNDVVMAAYFLDRGAELEARDDELQSTPLAWAAKFGRAAMVELLLARGAACPNADDPPWATPQAWAKRRGYTDLLAILPPEVDGDARA